jgi:hypothetical protein
MKHMITLVLLLLVCQVTVAAESLGRLFTTPKDRANLDYLRQTRKVIVPQKVEETSMQSTQALVLPNAVELQGYVKRSDGKKGTVWINQQAVQEGTKNRDISVGQIPSQQNRVPIQINASGKVLSLKAGQTYDPETNRVREMRPSVQGDQGRIGDEGQP